MRRIETKMQIAINEAIIALEKGELPIGAAAFIDDELISSCHTSEIEDKKLLVHAEIKVLQEIDNMGLSFHTKKKIELFTNLEPCMMCLGASISSFIGKIYYGLSSKSDGATIWAIKNWAENHIESNFQLPIIEGGVYVKESNELFKKYIEKHQSGPMVDWVQTIIIPDSDINKNINL